MASAPGTIRFGEVNSKPPAPPAGYALIYIKTDNVLYLQDSSGTEIPLGSASSITQLTGDVSAIGPGPAVATVNFVGGSSAANVHLAELLANAATNLNTASAIVRRDASGNFVANIITATLNGNASTSTNFTGSMSGDVTGVQSATVVSFVGTSSAANVHLAELLANAATSLNTGSALVRRDASGNFSASVITANLIGNVSGTSANITGLLAIVNGGTNSAAALVNNRIMVSGGSAIVEAAAIAAAKALISDANGIPIASITTATELSYVNGVISSIQGQFSAITGSAVTSLTGDVTGTGPGATATTISANVVSNAKLAQMPANSIKGNNTGATANALDLTASQVNVILGTVTTVGTFNGQPATAAGAAISGNSIFFQSASATNPGMMDLTTQTFAGNKTFTGTVAVALSSTSALTINTSSFVFDSTNNAVGIGIQPGTNTFIDAINSTATSKTLQLTGYGLGSTVGTRGRFARGTSGAPAAAQAGDIINFWSARGYGTSQFAAASTVAINAIAGETFTDTSNFTYLAFNTTPTGSVTSTENMRVASTGVTLGPQSASTSVHIVNGGMRVTRRTITANLTVDTTTSDYLILCNHTGAITITLPTPTDGRVLVIKDISGEANTNNVTIARHGSEKIEGLAASFIFQTNWGVLNLFSDGTDWYLN